MSSIDIASSAPPRWTPITAIERRILGVLLEKAKTTPDGYPLTLNALVTGCNQKNNRAPITQYEADDVQEGLDRLRARGAAAEVLGGGRVAKFRHYFYEWLGVDSLEAGVMAELLLRGPQTEGELRQRASRMESIADLSQLKTTLSALAERKLVISLTAPGRGHVVTHNLYEPRELERLQRQYGERALSAVGSDTSDADSIDSEGSGPDLGTTLRRPSPAPATNTASDLVAVRNDVDGLRQEVRSLAAQVGDLAAELQRLKELFGA